jgi:hypothetical protein
VYFHHFALGLGLATFKKLCEDPDKRIEISAAAHQLRETEREAKKRRIFVYFLDLTELPREKLSYLVSGCIDYCRKKYLALKVQLVAFIDVSKLSKEFNAELRSNNMYVDFAKLYCIYYFF